MKTQPLILFGAGGNAEIAFRKFASEGRMPVCFCDSNPSKANQLKKIDNSEVEILSLETALSRYPNADIYVTPMPPVKFEIIDNLLRGGGQKVELLTTNPIPNMYLVNICITQLFRKKNIYIFAV